MSEEATNAVPEWLSEAPFFRPSEDGAKSADQILADLNDAAQHMGNSLRIPGPDAGEDAMATFQTRAMEKIPGLMKTPDAEDAEGMSAIFGKLGRPAGADGYKVPEGLDLTPEQAGQVMGMAHAADMTQGQFSKYVSDWAAANGAAVTEAQNKHSQALEALKGEWGATYDKNVGEIASFLKSNSSTPDSVLQALEGGQLPAEQVRWLHSLAESVSPEDGQFHQQEDAGSGLVSPSEARDQIEEINVRLINESKDMTTNQRQGLMVKLLKLQYMADGNRPPSDGELLRAISG